MTDGVDLGCVSTAGDAHADVDAGELVEADDQEGLVDLESQDLGLDQAEGLSVDLDQSLTSLFLLVSILPLSIYLSSFVPCSERRPWLFKFNVSTALQQHTAQLSIPVFFLPKHCTLWDVDAIVAIGVPECFD